MRIRGLPIGKVVAALGLVAVLGLVAALSAPTAALAVTPTTPTLPPTPPPTIPMTTPTTTPSPTTSTTTPASTPTAPTTTSTPTPKPKPKPPHRHKHRHRHRARHRRKPPPPPPPVRATASVRFGGLFRVDDAAVTVPGRTVAVNGAERPWVSRQRLMLTAFLNGRRFEKTTLRLRYAGGRAGKFGAILRVPGSGRVSVVVEHAANDKMKGFRTSAGFTSLNEHVGAGSRGAFVKLIQQRLAALHFYIPETGVFDAGTGLALDAYHRMLGWGHAQTVDAATTRQLLNDAGTFKVRYPGQGQHAEADLSDQLLALIDGSQVRMIFPISSGKPSTPTILGSFRVYLRTPGYLPDGMYYSDFFTGGYAIHGYDPAPDYPASHGCLRLPIVDAITAYDWLKLGDPVDTYYT